MYVEFAVSRDEHPDLGALETLAIDVLRREGFLRRADRVAVRDWIRIDLADRLASHARKIRSAGGDDPVNAELATSVGLSEEAITRLMGEVGFAKAGEAWKWRGRHAPRVEQKARSYAFAELAKLKKQ